MEEARIPRMRTAAKIVAELKAIDPECEITEYCVRKMAKSGAVTVVWAGAKALINLDDVIELLRIGTTRRNARAPEGNGIRQVDVKLANQRNGY